MNDLHTHTTASDGVLSPMELLERARVNGIKRLAITDHDTVAGYLAICESDLARELKLISGVEISTVWRGIAIHIVGLNFNANHVLLRELLVKQAIVREERAKIILQRLARNDMPLNLKAIKKIAGGDHIGRPHIARAMLEKGYVSDISKAFKKYLGAGKIGDVKSGWCDIPTAIGVIKESGGVAVLAHPDKYKMTRTKLMLLLDEFKKAGGEAIEVISGKQHPSITEKYSRIAREKGFYASIGSDFHKPISHMADVGELAFLPSNLATVWDHFSC